MARGHLDELQNADIVSKSELVPSAFIQTLLNRLQVMNFMREVVVTDKFHCSMEDESKRSNVQEFLCYRTLRNSSSSIVRSNI